MDNDTQTRKVPNSVAISRQSAVTANIDNIDKTLSQSALSGLDWLGIVCELRSQNQELLTIIMRLEKALVDSQQQLQQQIRYFDTAENTRRQLQLRASQLTNELQTSQQVTQQQQWQLETLAEQLTATQEHISQLEEHCLLLQQDCQNQAEQREAAEKQVLELQAILQFREPLVAQQQAEEFAITPLDIRPAYLESLPTLPVDAANWSLPILPSLKTLDLPTKDSPFSLL